jgi:metallo-beta-lactamase class B
MKTSIAAALAFALSAAALLAQAASNTVDGHTAAARAAAGTEHVGVFNSLCMATEERASSNPAPARSGAPAPPPDRAKWHVEPQKVFDNLYYLGQSEYSAWAVNTSAGIIVIDTLFD